MLKGEKVESQIRTTCVHMLEKLLPNYKRYELEAQFFKEVFGYDAYSWLTEDLKPNTTLYDFGASIGDTAIYFSKFKEIKEIYSYEINKQAFNWANDNISKAKYKDKITIYNLPAILNSSLPYNTIIKCDVEGAEHEIFTKDANLSNVYRIMIEYHKGVQKLKDIFEEKGFKVKIWNNDSITESHILKPFGYIYAERWIV
jgi:hypothetical protein